MHRYKDLLTALALQIIFALVFCQPLRSIFAYPKVLLVDSAEFRAKLWKTYFLETYGGIRRRIPFQWNLDEKPPERGSCTYFPEENFRGKKLWIFPTDQDSAGDWIYNPVHRSLLHVLEKERNLRLSGRWRSVV